MDIGSMSTAKIKVIGVGGAGNNAVNKMAIEENMPDVELYAANTDFQALASNKAKNQILLGEEITHGLGAGAQPDVGRKAAESCIPVIKNAIRDADIVFIAAGMGGGTGTGASPVIAKVAREMGILTIGIVTRPFTFEGKTRNINAVNGLQELRPYVDSLIVINNDQLIQLMGNVELDEALAKADDVLCHSVKIISSIILNEARINLDFADIKTIMKDKGTALIGMGYGSGEDRARKAAEMAINNPLVEANCKGAKNAIINITYSSKMSLLDANEAVEIVREACENPDINIIFGASKDENISHDMIVTLIATDLEGSDVHRAEELINDHIELDNLGLSHIDAMEFVNEEENNSNSLDNNENKEEINEEEVEEELNTKIDDLADQLKEPEEEINEKKNHFLPKFLRRRGNK